MVRDRNTPAAALEPADVLQHDVDPLFLVWLVARSTEDLVDATLAATGLSGDDMALYSMLAASPATTPTEIARWMAAPATTVSSYVKRLAARGHAVREPNPADGRSWQVRLTPEGRAAHAAAVAAFGPLRARVGTELGAREAAVADALLELRVLVDRLRTELDAR